MARKRDILCAGPCGQMIYGGKGCLPEGQAMCQPCRRARSQTVERRVCANPECGALFDSRLTKPGGSFRATCSQRCRMAVLRLANGARTPSETPCPGCNKPVLGLHPARQCDECRTSKVRAHWARKNAKRSAEAAARRALMPPKPPKPARQLRPCDYCGGLTRTRFCSREHSDRWWTENRRRSWDKSNRNCGHCAAVFAPTAPGQWYCDATCMKRARRRRERQTGVRYNGDLHRHRARKFGRKYVPIKPLSIFERDGWVCQICNKKVPKDKKAPHPLAPTLDHIIPMSCDGGDHVPENVRLAHFECNWKRGAGSADDAAQLLLVG